MKKILIMMMLCIISIATKVAVAAAPTAKETVSYEVKKKTTKEETTTLTAEQAAKLTAAAGVSSTAAPAAVTKTVKEKLDGLKMTKKELTKYATDQKVSDKRKQELFKLDVSMPEYQAYLLDKLNADMSIPCLWCKKATDAKKDEKPNPVATPNKSSTPTSGADKKSEAPKSASPTAKAKSKFAHYDRYDFVRVGLGVRLLNSYTSDQPIGFNMSTSDSGLDLEYMVELKAWRVGFEYRPGHTVELEDKFYGSSIGKETLVTSNILIPKFYFVDGAEWSGSLGLIIEQANVHRSLSMGGFTFRKDVTPVNYGLQIAGEYHLTSWASMRGAWEIGGPKLTNYIPGVPDQTLQGTGRVLAMVVVGL